MKTLQIPVPKLFSEVIEQRPDGTWHARTLIDGEWRHFGSRNFSMNSPVHGKSIVFLPKADAAAVSEAIAAAERAQNAIRDIPAIERITLFNRALALLEQHESWFREILLIEAGKPAAEAEGEIAATKERLRMTMQEVKKITGEYIPGDWSHDTLGKIAVAVHEPVGVIVAITSFNYPLYIPAAKIIPALLSGNALVVKPASAVSLTLLCFARLLEEAGFPKGSINVVTGSSEIGDQLVSDPRVDMISFTGSTEVGRHIAGTARLKKLHLELGGKGMAIVLEDCDLELAAQKCVEGSLKNAGQRCDAVSAVIAVGKIGAPLVDRMAEIIKAWPGGDPRDSKTRVGPLINVQTAARIQGLVDDARSRGAVIRAGGFHQDCYFEPTLLDNVPPDARIALEETFGPVISVIRVPNEDQALSIMDRNRFGLDSCVFTNNFYHMWKLGKRLRVGGVTVNDLPRHGVGYFPFGGIGDSGIGREGIGYSIEEMTRLKTLVFNLEPAGLGKKKHIHKKE